LRINGLRRFSTKPHTIKKKLTISEEDEIIKLRRNHQYVASKIKHILKLKTSISTIHRFLKNKGFVRKYGYHIRPFYQNTIHMHLGNTKTIGYLQMDVKYLTPELT